MAYSKVATRFAKSLLSLAKEQNNLDAVYADMLYLSIVCVSNKDFVIMLKSPIIKSDKKLAVLEQLFGNKFSKISMAFLKIIISKKREFYLAQIAEQFIRQYKVHNGIITAKITTSITLTEKLRKQILQNIKIDSSKEIELIENVDEKIIGGIILRIDDQQIDASILSKIKELKREFNENLYVPDL